MRLARALLATFALSCLAVAAPARAADAPEKNPPEKSPAEKNAADKNPVELKVLDAGEGPRQQLRYKYRKGAVEDLAMDMDMAMSMSLGGQVVSSADLPTIRMTMRLETLDVKENGDATLGIRFTGGDVTAKPQTQAGVADAMRAELKKITGVRGTTTMSARGEARDAQFDLPAGADPQLKEQLKSAERQMGQMLAALPDQPVGKGARWQVTMPIDVNNVRASQTLTYSLKEQAGDVISVDVRITQTAARQEVQVPNAPQKLTLESLDSTGSGSARMDLARLVPADYAATIDMNMAMSQEQVRMSMNMKIGVTMRPEQPK
ncbi:MAG TPA: DUF6263 family protein [Humisphaera sp.]